ncbi:MAG: DNA-3-methyladenine glycosylase I [Nitratireductor sp.]|nr:DNA-3-methyladenine glycosylase I [Nitratireductor sp.]
MRTFGEIAEIARQRHGDAAPQGNSTLAAPKSPAELAAIPDDRYLSMATRCIFQSGFNWKVIDNKWDGFEAAFEGFDLGRWVLSNDDDIAALVSDKRIVRNGAKIATVPANARFFAGVSAKHGGVGRWLGEWPVTDQVGLLDALADGGSRLGGATGQYFLRFMGKDSFILSKDVTAALIREGVIEKPATSKKALAAVQQAFNGWAEESGQPMTVISRTLARSIDA